MRATQHLAYDIGPDGSPIARVVVLEWRAWYCDLTFPASAQAIATTEQSFRANGVVGPISQRYTARGFGRRGVLRLVGYAPMERT